MAADQTGSRPAVLLIQPPIYDFAAFDFFLYPLGLVNVGQALMNLGFRVSLLDTLDRFAAIPKPDGYSPATFRKDGCGHFLRRQVEPPAHLAHVPRRYFRFGLPGSLLEERLLKGPQPDAVGITCSMTYWYPGVIEMVDLVRNLWPGVPVLLGGIYPTLNPEHALKTCGPDLVLEGRDLDPAVGFLTSRLDPPIVQTTTFTGHSMLGDRPAAAVQASFGCPGGCPYCAAHLLAGPFRRRSINRVVKEIRYLIEVKGRDRIAFYDDALLEGEDQGFLNLLTEIRSLGLHRKATFHCPNAIRAKAVTEAVAKALKKTNFQTLRLGFETADPELQKSLGGKASNSDLYRAVNNLIKAGFGPEEIGAYILVGLPGQEPKTVEESIRFVHSAGALSRLAEYAPVPGTPLFEKARSISLLDLDDPINHNKTLAPFRFQDFGPEVLKKLKDMVREHNTDVLKKTDSSL